MRETEQNVGHIIDTLSTMQIWMSFWTVGNEDWSEGRDENLLEVFYRATPALTIECSLAHIADSLAIQLYRGKGKLRSTWPVPSNSAKTWMFDLFTLGLIEPSTRKHAVTDQNEYWSLTVLGKRVFAEIRAWIRRQKASEKETTG